MNSNEVKTEKGAYQKGILSILAINKMKDTKLE